MPSIAVEPIILTNVLLTVALDSYEKHVSKVEFVPTSSVVNWKGLHPTSNFSKTTTATWVCTLEYAQDWETADSLSQYLHENEGAEIDVTFEPEAGGAGFTATLSVTPGSIGGAVDTIAVASVSLGSTKPVYVPAA